MVDFPIKEINEQVQQGLTHRDRLQYVMVIVLKSTCAEKRASYSRHFLNRFVEGDSSSSFELKSCKNYPWVFYSNSETPDASAKDDIIGKYLDGDEDVEFFSFQPK